MRSLVQNPHRGILDTIIPEVASIPFGDLMFPLILIEVLKSLRKYRAMIDALKFYIRTYIGTLGENTLYLPVANPSSPLSGVLPDGRCVGNAETLLAHMYSLHIALYNECLYSLALPEYMEFFSHFEKVVLALNRPFYYDNLAIVKTGLKI